MLYDGDWVNMHDAFLLYISLIQRIIFQLTIMVFALLRIPHTF
jgi:hypothetical protein